MGEHEAFQEEKCAFPYSISHFMPQSPLLCLFAQQTTWNLEEESEYSENS